MLELRSNGLRSLPDSIGNCFKLKYLDVADNELTVFPPFLPECKLLCEMNPLVEDIPVGAVQEGHVLSLTECVIRRLLDHCRQNNNLDLLYAQFPSMVTAGRCALCSKSFYSIWLECVRFAKVEHLGLTSCTRSKLPVRAFICSYKVRV